MKMILTYPTFGQSFFYEIG